MCVSKQKYYFLCSEAVTMNFVFRVRHIYLSDT